VRDREEQPREDPEPLALEALIDPDLDRSLRRRCVYAPEGVDGAGAVVSPVLRLGYRGVTRNMYA